jgi:hypothetical protein
MSNNTRQLPKQNKPRRKLRRLKKVLMSAALAAGVMGIILAQWNAARVATGGHAVLSPAAAQEQDGSVSSSAKSPSKEYIYAGGKLVATVEPTPTPTPTPAGGD